MKKLALINPGRRVQYVSVEPLGLECIAAYIQKYGVDVKIIEEPAGQDVRSRILKYKPDIVGITGMTPIILDSYRIADMCRKMGIRTVIGGVHATILPEEALQHADIVVTGEGEIAMRDIIQQDVKSGIIKGTPVKNLDDIPIFDRSKIDMDFHMRMTASIFQCAPPGALATCIFTQRGCNYRCTFCHNSWSNLPYRCNSAGRVIDEIQYLVKQYHVKVISFQDDNLFMNKPRVKEICQKLINSNMSIIWACNARVDNVDSDILKLAYQAGCRQIFFGLESGSQRMLDVLNKKTTIEQNIKAIQMCHEIGIRVTSTFMIGNPTETVEDIRMTQQFIKDNPIDDSAIAFTTPLPGTQIWEWGRERGLIPEHPDWSKFDFRAIGYSACDTIPSSQLEMLYRESSLLVASTQKRISLKWLISMYARFPVQMSAIFLRSTSWTKYKSRLSIKGG